jgi:6-phosphofructokinase
VIDKCFGFDTAVEEAQRAVMAAKVEATSAYKGIGLVKLMGRQSGFITMQASMASGAPRFNPAVMNAISSYPQVMTILELPWVPQCCVRPTAQAEADSHQCTALRHA